MNATQIRRIARGTWDKLNFGLPVVLAKARRRYAPFQLTFSLTNRCNLRCAYCYADYPQRPQKDLSLQDVLTIIDGMAKLGTRRVNLVGGEPLIRKDIGDIIAHITENLGLECAMTTNGYFVPRKIEHVRKLHLLCVSLDGRRENHDATRGPGSYDKAMEALRLAIDEGVAVQAACVLNKHNLADIEYLLELGRDMGFAVGFSTLISEANGPCGQTPDYQPTDDEYRVAIQRLIELKQQGYPVLFSIPSLEYALHWPHSYAKDKIIGQTPDFPYIRCNAGRYFCLVDVNGDVYPCPAVVDVLPAKNALKDGVKAAFEHAGQHPCKTCHIPCVNDFNLLYSLDPRVILNIWKTYQPRSKKRIPASRPRTALAFDASTSNVRT